MGDHRSPDDNWRNKKYPYFAWARQPAISRFSVSFDGPGINEIFAFLHENDVEFVLQEPDRGVNLWRFYFHTEEGRNFFMLYYSDWFTYTH